MRALDAAHEAMYSDNFLGERRFTGTGNTAIVVCLTSGARRTLPPRLERLGTRAIGAAGVTDSGGTLVDACTGSFYNVVRPQRTVKNTAIVVC